MFRHWLVLGLVTVVFITGACRDEPKPQDKLVGFGPMVGGKYTGYCYADSPILAWPQTRRLLDISLPEPSQQLETEAAMIAFVNQVLAKASPGTRLLIDRSVKEAGMDYRPPPQPPGGMTLDRLFLNCYGPRVDFVSEGGCLVVQPVGGLAGNCPWRFILWLTF